MCVCGCWVRFFCFSVLLIWLRGVGSMICWGRLIWFGCLFCVFVISGCC